MDNWQKLHRSERATICGFECDVWPISDGARYTVLAPNGRYLAGGRCASVEWAKEVSSNFARSVSEIAA